jgi:hypothetical protein
MGALGVNDDESDDGEEESVRRPGPGGRKRPSGRPPAASASFAPQLKSFFSRPYRKAYLLS